MRMDPFPGGNGSLHLALLLISESQGALGGLALVAKANPEKISMASGGNGASSHISGEMFKMLAGVDMVHVPYRGAGPALTAVVSGQAQLYFSPLSATLGYVKQGQLRILAVTGRLELAILEPYGYLETSPTPVDALQLSWSWDFWNFDHAPKVKIAPERIVTAKTDAQGKCALEGFTGWVVDPARAEALRIFLPKLHVLFCRRALINLRFSGANAGDRHRHDGAGRHGHRRRSLAVRLPALASQHDRGWDLRGVAEHPGRAGAWPAPQPLKA